MSHPRRGLPRRRQACPGIKLVQASHFNEELLVVHNLDIRGGRQFELDDFNYEFDFRQVYRPIEAGAPAQESID
ncbi:MAG: hypothetical protein R6X23_14185 [Acidimicrobiia bacterium]